MAPDGGQGAEPLEAHGFKHFKSQRKPVSEGKIHTITQSLSGPSFNHVLALTFMLFLNDLSTCKHVCYDVELNFDWL